MIRLNVAEYCSECPDFEPVAEVEEYCYSDPQSGEPVCVRRDTKVTCVRKLACECIKNYIKNKSEG